MSIRKDMMKHLGVTPNMSGMRERKREREKETLI
jgi:hypothetical protein